MFTRRTATVTMSAPEAACACAITACEEYLPVPTMSREANVRPAITKGVSVTAFLPASDEVHDLEPVAFADDDLGKVWRLMMVRLCSMATRRGSISSLASRPATEIGSSNS